MEQFLKQLTYGEAVGRFFDISDCVRERTTLIDRLFRRKEVNEICQQCTDEVNIMLINDPQTRPRREKSGEIKYILENDKWIPVIPGDSNYKKALPCKYNPNNIVVPPWSENYENARDKKTVAISLT